MITKAHNRIRQAAALTLIFFLAAMARGDEPRRGTNEGIRVHGHWTIEVRNPDGTLTERREFENALDPDEGHKFLVFALSRLQPVFNYAVTLDSLPQTTKPCAELSDLSLGAPGGCHITEAVPSRSFPFPNLKIGTEVVNLREALVLAGNATVSFDSTISVVRTSNFVCTYPICGFNHFTKAEAPRDFAPVNVVAGQIVQVKVVISFT